MVDILATFSSCLQFFPSLGSIAVTLWTPSLNKKNRMVATIMAHAHEHVIAPYNRAITRNPRKSVGPYCSSVCLRFPLEVLLLGENIVVIQCGKEEPYSGTQSAYGSVPRSTETVCASIRALCKLLCHVHLKGFQVWTSHIILANF